MEKKFLESLTKYIDDYLKITKQKIEETTSESKPYGDDYWAGANVAYDIVKTLLDLHPSNLSNSSNYNDPESINVKGQLHLIVNYDVDLPMSEDDFDSARYREQIELIYDSIDWETALNNVETPVLKVNQLNVMEGAEQ